MNRCAIPREDGVVRIGILCDPCSRKALDLLLKREKPFWVQAYTGPRACEGCLAEAELPNMEENDG